MGNRTEEIEDCQKFIEKGTQFEYDEENDILVSNEAKYLVVADL